MVENKNQTFKDYKPAIIFGGGGLLIIIILIAALGVPLYNNMTKTTKELKAKKNELAMLEKKLDNLKTLQSKEAELVVKNQKVLAALPQDKDVSRLFVQFENIATQNGLNISSVSEGNHGTVVAPVGGLAPVTYVINGSVNNYASLKSALAKIESALRVLSVEKVDISGGSGSLGTVFNVTTYVRGADK